MRRVFPLLLVFSLLLAGGLYLYQQSSSERTGGKETQITDAAQLPSSDSTSKIEETEKVGFPPIETPWPQSSSDILPDSRALFGKLANGLRYVIVPNQEPPGRVSLRMHIDAGSLSEEEDQRGVAHFLEHMVFNGSENFTPGELIQKMQRLGIAFGAHANAYTSFDETVYMLDMPDVEEATLKLGMTVMRDFADGALLLPEEIENERGVVISEKTSRDSVQQRLMEQQFADLLPDSKITRRFPIGTEEVLKTAQQERFKHFYETFYAPQLMTFVAVGDVDPGQMRSLIEESFGSMINQRELPEKDYGNITQSEDFNTAVYADPEVVSTQVSLVRVSPYEQQPDTRERRLQKLPLEVAHQIMSRRFSKLALKEGSPISSGSAARYDLFNLVEIGSFDLDAVAEKWPDAVRLLEQEVRRALNYGFTKSELKEVSADLLNQYEQAVARAQTRESSGIAMQLIRSINDNRVFSTPETDLEIIRTGLTALTLDQINNGFKAFWDNPGLTLSLTTQVAPENGEAVLKSIYEESQSAEVEVPEELVVQPWTYTDFGPAGNYERTEVTDLGITQLIFDNNVRVNLKQTDFEQGTVRVNVRFGSGKLTMPLEMPGLDTFLSSTFIDGGLGQLSTEQLENTLAGKNVQVNFSISDDSFALSGQTTPEDLELQLQYLLAYLTDHGRRPEAIRSFRNTLPAVYNGLEHTQQGPLMDIQARLHNQDPRFIFPDQDTLESYTFDEADQWILPELAVGYLELSIVGDFDPVTAADAIARTFGTLPQRDVSPPELYESRLINFLPSPDEKTLVFNSKLKKALSLVIWQTKGLTDDISESRRLNLLGSILDDRMREKIREELGAAYSPSAGSTQSSAFPNIGYIQAYSPGKPDDTRKVGALIRDIAEDLSIDGVTEDELERAKQPVLTMLEQSSRSNSYWLSSVLANCQAQPERLDWARNRDEDVASITSAELTKLASKYLAGSNSIVFNILPEVFDDAED